MEKMCLKSFVRHGHEVHVYTYGEVEGVPDRVEIRNGNKVLPESEIFTYQKGGFGEGSVAGFADHFRLELLNQRGGWWVDTDIICLQAFDFDEERVVATSYEHEWGVCAINCVMKLPKGDPILEYCLSRIKAINEDNVEFGETGPHLLQEAIQELGAQNILVKPNVFCPIGWRDTDHFVSSVFHRALVNTKRFFEGRRRASVPAS